MSISGLWPFWLRQLRKTHKIGCEINCRHMKDLDFIHDLTAATVVCPYCKDRLVVDKKVTNVKYCHCKDTKSAYDKKVKG